MMAELLLWAVVNTEYAPRHVTVLEQFTTEAACRAKVALVSRAMPQFGIPANPNYDCWPRDRYAPWLPGGGR